MTATSPFLLCGKAPAAGAAEQPFWAPSHVQHQPAADRTERRHCACRSSRGMITKRDEEGSMLDSPSAEFMLVPRRVRAPVPTRRTASYGHHVTDRL